MPKIRILPDVLINKIAAGEVIERPASVVKELLENSLDAGAKDLRIEVIRGGKRLIRVSDDGEGMDREDALLSFERHATSKLNSEHDLSRITTMGFRGEALSSIAAVSKMRLSSVLKGEAQGVSLDVEGGAIRSEKAISGIGSVIEVRDLFFNTPVRKKFMKSDGTELYHVIDAVNRAALIHNSVRFLLAADGRTVIDVYGARGLRERLVQLYGPDFLTGLIEMDSVEELKGINMEGFIALPGNARKTRAHQYLYVNGRPVMDKSLRHAIYKAYEEKLTRDEHPIYILNISINPESIDVNVHPSKKEIRFMDREPIYNGLFNMIRAKLRERENKPAESTAIKGLVSPDEGMKSCVHAGKGDEWDASYQENRLESHAGLVAETTELFSTIERSFVYIGDVFVAYAENGRLCVLDHHAAHERVLYERLRKGIHLESYRLLFPRQVRLNAREYDVVLRHQAVLSGMGIDVEDFGGDTVVVRALPGAVDEAGLEGVLSDVAEKIMDIKASSPLEIVRNEIAKSIACHSSVRGTRILGKVQLSRLLADLDEAEDPHHCPHGRPTRVYYSIDDLKKIFERV